MLGIICHLGNGQIKTVMRYHLTHTKLVVIKKKSDTKICWQGCSEIGTAIYFWLIVKWCSYFGKSLAVSQKIRHRAII